MGSPLISVVLANYNGAQFLPEAVESIFRQTYEHWELILVDDCSTDDSWHIMSQWQDPRIRLHRNERNLQVAESHNIGVSLARGEYVAIMDHDDRWAPRKLELQLAYLEAHPQVAACFAWPDFIDEQGKNYQDENLAKLFYVENRSRAEWLRLLLTTGNHLANDSVLVRREILTSLGRENPAFIQLHDYDLWLRLALKHEFYVFPEFLMSYRKFPGNHSNSDLSERNQRRVFFEYTYIAGRAIRNMEGELFCQVFQDQLIHPHPASEAELLCEKALLLTRDLFLSSCREHAFALLEQIQQDPEARRVLAQEYGFSPRDIHQLTGQPILYDRLVRDRLQADEHRIQAAEQQIQVDAQRIQATEYRAEAAEQRAEIAEQHIQELNGIMEETARAADNQIQALTANLAESNWELQQLSEEYEALKNTFAGRCLERWQRWVSKHENFYLNLRLSKVALTKGRKEAAERKAAYFYEKRMYPIYGKNPQLPWDQWQAQQQTAFPEKITFCLVALLDQPSEKALQEMIASVQVQSYSDWELCLLDESPAGQETVQQLCQCYAAEDQRIKYRRLDWNLGFHGNLEAYGEATQGMYYALLGQGDLLHPGTLFHLAQAIHLQGADALYCDEAEFIDTPSDRCAPQIKPDFSLEAMRREPFHCHFLAFSQVLLPADEQLLSEGQVDALMLYLAEKAKRFLHVPHILYYNRSK